MAVSPPIADNLARLRERIAAACSRVGRDPASVELLAVSKAHGVERIVAAHAAGLRTFGENYAQELAHKAEALGDLPDVRWRFIGHLQRNKIKLVELARATVDTLDSARLARALSSRAVNRGYRFEVLIQVNVAAEPQKSGCRPEELSSLVEETRRLPGLDLRGLMTVAPHFDHPEDTRPTFAALRQLADQHELQALSMGMTHDLEAAIAEGATMVRVGTALFGQRSD